MKKKIPWTAFSADPSLIKHATRVLRALYLDVCVNSYAGTARHDVLLDPDREEWGGVTDARRLEIRGKRHGLAVFGPRA